MEPKVLKAYNAWKNQGARCNSRRSKSYVTYGAKNIKRLYSSREFISWFLLNAGEDWETCVVGRIDHNKSYSLDNIQIETKSQSLVEMITRHERRIKTGIFDRDNNLIAIAESQAQAAFYTGVRQSCVCLQIMRSKKDISTRRKRSGWIFKDLN